MKLTVLGSSSAGNCYILQNDSEAIVLEAGFNLSEVKRVLDFNINKVKAVLVTHEHGDHAKYAKNFEQVFPLYTNESVIKAKGLQRSFQLEVGMRINVGNFKIMSFQADHDVECTGFFIGHPDMGNLLFITDSATCDYEFKHLNHIMVECNYSDKELDNSVENGLHPYVAKRVRGTHMELNTTKEVLQAQNLDNVYNIILLHLSKDNSDPKFFKEYLSATIGKPIKIAKPGLEIELENRIY